MVIKVNREDKLLLIGKEQGYLNIHLVCRILNLIYDNQNDRYRAINKIIELKELGKIKKIEGTIPYKYEVIEQVTA